MAAASEQQVQEYCDTELRLGRGPAPPPTTPGTANGAGGCLMATELQAMAILGMATKAAAEEYGPAQRAEGEGTDERLSVRRSLKWFLQRRAGGSVPSPPLHHPA